MTAKIIDGNAIAKSVRVGIADARERAQGARRSTRR